MSRATGKLTSGNLTNGSRVHRRNLLLLAGALPTLLAVLFAGKVALMLDAQGDGDAAYARQGFAEAGEEYAANKAVNVLESWIAPFNTGAALFRDDDMAGAITEFEIALESVPEDRECQVRVNIALAHEVIGDAVAESSRPEAIKSWQAGRDVLAQGDCPASDETARTVDDRLRQKIEQEPPEEQESGEEDQEQQDEQERKREELEQRNERGREERKENQRFEDYPYVPRDPEFQW